MENIHIYVDGACSGNPGPSGIGVYLKYKNYEKTYASYIGNATNNIAELTAILEGLKLITNKNHDIIIYTDSQYCIGVLHLSNNAVANIELIAEIKEYMKLFKTVNFIKVKAHNGNHGNEIANKLATDIVKQVTMLDKTK